MMKKILVPYDDSGFSQKAFEKGLEIAEKFQSQLIVLTVIQSKTSNSTGTSLERAQEIQDEEENAVNIALEKLADQAKAKNVSFSMEILHNPSASDGVVNFAQNNNIDLIVIGSHGRTGLTKLVLGSVAQGVLAHAKCPVLITKGSD